MFTECFNNLTLEEIKELNLEEISMIGINHLLENIDVTRIENMGYSSNKVGYRWFVVYLSDNSDISVYVDTDDYYEYYSEN